MLSLRRYYLDKYLEVNTKNLKGELLDIGGKKKGKRGNFRANSNLNVYYLNNDETTDPDFKLDAKNFHEHINKKFDFFFLNEVLEHLDNPQETINSSYEILKNGGTAFISMPFMYRKHEDPIDMQRWTDTKIIKSFEKSNFIIDKIIPMGGLFCVIHDFWMFSSNNSNKLNPLGFLNKICFRLISPILKYLDLKTKYLENFITSGWFIVVKKK